MAIAKRDMTTLRDLGERGLIRRLARLLPGSPDVQVGIGTTPLWCRWRVRAGSRVDVRCGDRRDAFSSQRAGEKIGHKAIGRGVSDLAAMGAEPLWPS